MGITKATESVLTLTNTENDIADNASDIADNATDIDTIDTNINYISVRHCILNAVTDSDGYNNMLSATSTGQVELDATTKDCVLTWANGFDQKGEVNYIAKLTSDQSPAAWDLSGEADGDWYMYIDNDGSGNLTYGKTKKAPHYGAYYPNDLNALLHFEGADASTTITDEYSNSWEVSNDAQIKTDQFKFGSSSSYLDGTGDSIVSTDISKNHPDAWTFEVWVRPANLTGDQCIVDVKNGNFGVRLAIKGTTGQLELSASSNGSSNDIASNTVSTGVTVISALNWHHVALEFTGTHLKTYIDGVVKHDINATFITNNAGNYNLSQRSIKLGLNYANNDPYEGHMDDLRLTKGWARYGQAFTAPTETFTPDNDLNWFDTNSMKMYVGNPTTSWTATNRLFVGQVNKASSTYTVTNYAIQGRYESEIIDVAVGTIYSKNHNIGTDLVNTKGLLRHNSGTHWADLQKILAGDYYGANINITKLTTTIDFDTTGTDDIGGVNTFGNASFPNVSNNGEAKLIIERAF